MNQIKSFEQFINENNQVKTSAGLAIIWEGKILLAHTAGRNFRTGYGIPKGGIEVGETNIDAAIREVQEEIGVKVPRDMVNPRSYQFGVDARKLGFKKIVHYFIVEISLLSQVGLKDTVIPKGWLQLEEINDARFMGLSEAREVTMKSQQPLLDNLEKLGLIK